MWVQDPFEKGSGCWVSTFSVSGPGADLNHWTLAPNNNIRRSMVATLLEDAEINHQLRVCVVSASDGSAGVTCVVSCLGILWYPL